MHGMYVKSDKSVTHAPVHCAMTNCNQIMSVTAILTHYIRDHNNNYAVDCHEILHNERLMFKFQPECLNWQESVCVGLLVYGDKNRELCPAERGLCAYNSSLPKGYERFDAHLPILIMACRTSWANFLCDKNAEHQISNEKDDAQQMLVIWLTSAKVTSPIHCTLTVLNKSLTMARSSIIEIRNFYDSQNPREFLLNDVNCVRLSSNDMKKLSHNCTESTYLEMVIKEY